MVEAQVQAARAQALRRRELAKAGKKSNGAPRNSQDQLVHSEERIHGENTDREADQVSALDRENEITEWRRHSDLDFPPARPGYVNRLIRIRLGTTADLARLRQTTREGWRPIKASSLQDNSLPTIHLNQFGDVIGVEDLVLCEMPERLDQQRKAFYAAEQVRMNQASNGEDLAKISRSDVAGFGPIQQDRNTKVSLRRPGKAISPANDDD